MGRGAASNAIPNRLPFPGEKIWITVPPTHALTVGTVITMVGTTCSITFDTSNITQTYNLKNKIWMYHDGLHPSSRNLAHPKPENSHGPINCSQCQLGTGAAAATAATAAAAAAAAGAGAATAAVTATAVPPPPAPPVAPAAAAVAAALAVAVHVPPVPPPPAPHVQAQASASAGKGTRKVVAGMLHRGTGKGIGTAKRHKRVNYFEDYLKGISKPSIRRLARRGGVKRIGGLIYDETRDTLKKFLENVCLDACTYMAHARRKTITTMDIIYALKRQGRSMYGFGG